MSTTFYRCLHGHHVICHQIVNFPRHANKTLGVENTVGEKLLLGGLMKTEILVTRVTHNLRAGHGDR